MFVLIDMGFVGLQLFECDVCFSSDIGICGRDLIGWGFIGLQLFECEACFFFPAPALASLGEASLGYSYLNVKHFFSSGIGLFGRELVGRGAIGLQLVQPSIYNRQRQAIARRRMLKLQHAPHVCKLHTAALFGQSTNTRRVESCLRHLHMQIDTFKHACRQTV